MLANQARPLFRLVNKSNVAQIKRAYQIDTSYHRFPCFNDLPVPQGDWQKAYQATQLKNNLILGATIAAFAGTVAYIRATDAVFVNWAPPETYE